MDVNRTDIDAAIAATGILSDLLEASQARETQLAEAVNHWVTQSQDKSLSEAARETYLECAQTVIDIFT